MIKSIINLAKILYRAFGHYKKVLVLLFILSLVNGALEGIGITTIVPIFSFLSQGQNTSADVISGYIERGFVFLGIPFTLKFLLIFIIVLFVLKSIVLFLSSFITAKIAANYEKDIRRDLFKATLQGNWKYLSKQKMGHLDQVLTTDIYTASSLLFLLSTSAIILAKLIIYSGVAVNLSFVITALALGLGSLLFLVFKPLYVKNKRMSEKISQVYKDLAHFVNESIVGMKTVKSFLAEREVVARGNDYFEQVKKYNIKSAVLRSLSNASIQPVGLIFIMAIFAYYYKTSIVNFASFVVIVYAINQIFTLLQAGQNNFNALVSAVPYIKNVLDYRDLALNNKETDEGKGKFIFKEALKAEELTFNYEKDQPVLNSINFSLAKGEMVGLIGPSGAGKTTIVDLLLRLLSAEKGTISVDGRDIKEIALSEWRANVGYVSQDVFLMNDTIAKNIRFYDDSIKEEEIIEATKAANIYDFILSLPNKFDTIIGERGTLLSNGQRQRVALARVLARRQKILILDEATSALDNESEALIQEAILKLKGKITILVIAHRLSTVMATDRIIVLENGKIIEEGKPDRLLKDSNSYFYKVYNIRELA